MFDSRRGTAFAIAAVVALVAASWVHPYRAQQASRYALTAALAEQQTIVLDDYQHVLGVDRAVREGRNYSDKAPGQPFMGVPFYLAFRAFGGAPATELRIEANIGLWWQTLWFSSVPLGFLAALIYLDLERRRARFAIQVSLALALGTILLPLGSMLFGHVLSALLVYGAWYVGRSDEWPIAGRLVAGGLLLGLAVLVEYTAVIAAAIVSLALTLRCRRAAGWLVAGGIPSALALGWYNAIAWGSPFVFSYSYSAFEMERDDAQPLLSLFGALQPQHLWDLFFSHRGFVFAAPIVVIAVVYSMPFGRSARGDFDWLPLTLFVAYLMIPLFWGNPWGGDSPGPRYMTQALPFLALPLARAWRAHPLPVSLAAGWSGMVMLIATATDPFLPQSGDWGVTTWSRWALDGEFATPLSSTIFGSDRRTTAVILLVLAVGAVPLVIRCGGSRCEPDSLGRDTTDTAL